MADVKGGEDRNALIAAVEQALAGEWEVAHAFAQRHEGWGHADWLHAILHKIEGDESNSRYWYRRTPHAYEAWTDPKAELQALKAVLGY